MELKDMTFDQFVDYVAGQALMKLIRGENWRTIIFGVCDMTVRWRAEKR